MAFSPDSFKKAIGSPMSAPGGAPGGDSGLDLDSLMGAPGMENGPGDIEGPGGEGAEMPLQQALEQAGYQVDSDKLSQIKAILGEAGGMAPEAGMDGELPPPPMPEKPMSKLGKLLGKK